MPHRVEPGLLGVPGGLRQGETVAALYGDSWQDDADLEASHAIKRATST
ncbi:unnamed protein product [[Actinomadura] parvosata subsp. kistnae]|nr:unnamed protein product [Actinomadura parvosata subsp. kistnae]